MSIRKNDRRLSQTEYDNTYNKIFNYILQKVSRLPKRYQKILGKSMTDALGEVLINIENATVQFHIGKDRSADRRRNLYDALKAFNRIITVSYFWWTLPSNKNEIRPISQRQRNYWSESVNKSVALITGVLKTIDKNFDQQEVDIPHMYSISKAEINSVQFLKYISGSLSIMNRCAIKYQQKYENPRIYQTINRLADALKYAIDGNKRGFDGSLSDYKKRYDYFNKAIGNLKAIQQDILRLSWEYMFSEEELKTLATNIDSATKILVTLNRKTKNIIDELKIQ